MPDLRARLREALSLAERSRSPDEAERLALLEELVTRCREILCANAAEFGSEEQAALTELRRALAEVLEEARSDRARLGDRIATLASSRRARSGYAKRVTFGDQIGLRA